MVTEKRRDESTVVRIPRDTYEEAEKVRQKLKDGRRDGSDPFAIIAAAGIGAFLGGLIGYAIANLEKNRKDDDDEKGKSERR